MLLSPSGVSHPGGSGDFTGIFFSRWRVTRSHLCRRAAHVEVVQFQRLLERKHVFRFPLTGQRLGNRLLRGVATRMTQLGKFDGIPFPGHNGTQNRLSRVSCNIGQYLGQLKFHNVTSPLYVRRWPDWASRWSALKALKLLRESP